MGDAKARIQEEPELLRRKEELVTLASELDSMKEWSTKFSGLPSKENIQTFDEFKLPSEESVDFEHFLNPEPIRKLFSSLKEAQKDLKEGLEIAKEYDVTPTPGQVRSLAASFKKLEKALNMTSRR